MNDIVNATSTVCSSIYSVTALIGACAREEILNAFAIQKFACTVEQLEAAIDEGLARGFLVDEAGKICAAGPPGWIVWIRDPDDAEGWSGWVARNIKTGETTRLDLLLKLG